MKDEEKSKEQLISELVELRQQVAALNETSIQLRLAEKLLQESNEKYRLLFENAPTGIYEIDFLNLKFTSVNDVMCEYTGYKKEELLSMNPFDILSEESKIHFCERLQNGFLGKRIPESTEFKVMGKNGREFWSLISAKYKYENGIPVGASVVAHDITERKKIEEALRLSEEKFYKVFNASPALLVITTLDGRYIDVNENFFKTTGYSREEVIGRTAIELGLYVDANVHHNNLPLFYKNKEIRNQEVIYRMKSGELRTGMSSAEIIELNGEKCILAVVIDVTEKRQMELEMLRLDRLYLVGEMAAGIGHEIRNPMTAVRGFLQILENKKDCIHYKDYFDLMIDELDRANVIISEFLSMAKNKPVDLEKKNLNTILEAISPLIIANAVNFNIYTSLEMGKVPDLLLNEKEIRQLILNIVKNGIEAMEQGGNLTIKTFWDGNEVVISIQDQGNGIKCELLDKIGTPFFTTKESGTGLGLAVCYGIAARHNATIKVDTGTSGTTFSVRFKNT